MKIEAAYIRRGDAYQAVQDHFHRGGFQSYDDGQACLDCITKIPAADVVEVRRGHWVYKMRELIRYENVTGTDPLGEVHTVTVKTHIRGSVPYCSLCDALAADSFLDYCPRCGAKMDKEADDV